MLPFSPRPVEAMGGSPERSSGCSSPPTDSWQAGGHRVERKGEGAWLVAVQVKLWLDDGQAAFDCSSPVALVSWAVEACLSGILSPTIWPWRCGGRRPAVGIASVGHMPDM